MDIQLKSKKFLAKRRDLRGVDIYSEWRLLLTKKEINTFVKYCASIIEEKYEGKNLVIVCILKGCMYFCTDLTRLLRIPHSVYMIEASSYHDKQTQSDKMEVLSLIQPDKFNDKYVVILDELYDNGFTLESVKQEIIKKGNVTPDKIFTCTLFKKNKNVIYPPPNLYGALVCDLWLTDFGLDDCSEKRNWEYLYACPKKEGIPKSEDDKIFDDDNIYKKIRENLVDQYNKCLEKIKNKK